MSEDIQEWITQKFLKAVFHKFYLGPFLNTLTHIHLSFFYSYHRNKSMSVAKGSSSNFLSNIKQI